MNGARFVHEQLELRVREVQIADALRVTGLAPLACKTDRIDAWVLAELSHRELVPAIWQPDPSVHFERFERARWLWIDSQDDDYSRPAFYAACKTDDGIVIINGWETDAAHKAFAHRMGPHLETVGMGRPDDHPERMWIAKLGWG